MKTTPDTKTIKTHNMTIRVRPNAWGNWYGYIGREYVALFMGDYEEQQADAYAWGALLAQASALSTV